MIIIILSNGLWSDGPIHGSINQCLMTLMANE